MVGWTAGKWPRPGSWSGFLASSCASLSAAEVWKKTMDAAHRLLEAHLYSLSRLWPLIQQPDAPDLGIHAQSALQKARLDDTADSLQRLENLLDWLHEQGGVPMQTPAGENLQHLLALWLLNRSGRTVQRYWLPEVARQHWPQRQIHPRSLWVVESQGELLDPFAPVWAGLQAQGAGLADWLERPHAVRLARETGGPETASVASVPVPAHPQPDATPHAASAPHASAPAALDPLDREALIEQMREQQRELRAQWEDSRMPLWKMLVWAVLLGAVALLVLKLVATR